MTTREERLNRLKTAVIAFADAEEERLQNEVTFLESMLAGAAEGGVLGAEIEQVVSGLVEDELDAFLEP